MSRAVSLPALAFAIVTFTVGQAMEDYFLPWPYLGQPYAEMGSYLVALSGILLLTAIALALVPDKPEVSIVVEEPRGIHLRRILVLLGIVLIVTTIAVGLAPRPLASPLRQPLPTLADTALYGFNLVFPYGSLFLFYESPQAIGQFALVGPWLVPEIGTMLVVLLILAGVGRGWPFPLAAPRRTRPPCVTALAAFTMACGGIVATAGYVQLVPGLLPLSSPMDPELLVVGGLLLGLGLLVAISAEGLSIRHRGAWWCAFVGAAVAAVVAVPALQSSAAGASAFVVGLLLLEREEFGVLGTGSGKLDRSAMPN